MRKQQFTKLRKDEDEEIRYISDAESIECLDHIPRSQERLQGPAVPSLPAAGLPVDQSKVRMEKDIKRD